MNANPNNDKMNMPLNRLGAGAMKVTSVVAIVLLVLLVLCVWFWGKAGRAKRNVEKLGGTVETSSYGGGPWANVTVYRHRVDLSNTDLTDDQLAKLIPSLQTLAKVDFISYLNLSNTNIGPAGIELLAQVEDIRAIEITNARVTLKESRELFQQHIVDNSGPHAIPHSGCQRLLLSPSGRKLAVLGLDEFQIVETETGNVRTISQGGRYGAFSSDEQHLVVASNASSTVFHVGSMEVELTIPSVTGPSSFAVFGENDTTVLLAGDGVREYRRFDGQQIDTHEGILLGTCRRFQGSTVRQKKSFFVPGKGELRLPRLPIPFGAMLTVASADGGTIAWIGDTNLAAPDRGLVLVDATTGNEIKAVPIPGTKKIMDACFDRFGKRIAIARFDGSVSVLDVDSEAWIFQHRDSAGGALHVSLSDDGRMVAAAFEYPSTKWWEIDDTDSKYLKE